MVGKKVTETWKSNQPYICKVKWTGVNVLRR